MDNRGVDAGRWACAGRCRGRDRRLGQDSRGRARADLRSGSSLGAAVAGADVVVDTVNAQRKAESVLVEGTKR
ncbi:MAG: hypothetical protein ACXVHI_01380, partial [Frankiaceae bacterium]